MPRIGLGIDIARRGAGISWQAYWATLKIAYIENANLDKLVVIFDDANTSLSATDFSLTGTELTISNLDRDVTNKIFTFTLSGNATYGTSFNLVFSKVSGSGEAVVFKDNRDEGVHDANVAAAIDATSQLVDVVMMGDSNQVHDSHGWDASIQKELASRYGMYGSGLISINEADGLGAGQGYTYARLNASGNKIGEGSGQPSPFDDIWATCSNNMSGYMAADSESGFNNIFILLANSAIGNENALTFRMHIAKFASGGGTFYPRVRYEQSPWTSLAGGGAVACTAAADEMTYHDLSINADAGRTEIQLGLKLFQTETMTAKFFGTFVHAFKTGASAGIAGHTLCASGGDSLADLYDRISALTSSQLGHYFGIIRTRQIGLGQATPNIIIRINSGLNDRNETDDSDTTYGTRLQAIIDKFKEVWTDNGWSLSELSFVITPSHRVSDPDDAELLTYRTIARTVALVNKNTTMVDFGYLMTYAEAVAGSWYNGVDINHLLPAGSEALATREVTAIITQ
jgi:hypothetical protein